MKQRHLRNDLYNNIIIPIAILILDKGKLIRVGFSFSLREQKATAKDVNRQYGSLF